MYVNVTIIITTILITNSICIDNLCLFYCIDVLIVITLDNPVKLSYISIYLMSYYYKYIYESLIKISYYGCKSIKSPYLSK